jgi:hypothetical protein
MLGCEYPFIRKKRTLSQTTIQKTPLVAFGGRPLIASFVALHLRTLGCLCGQAALSLRRRSSICLRPAHAPPIVQIVVSAEEVVWACGRDALEKISDGREARVAGSLVVEHAATDKIQLWLW